MRIINSTEQIKIFKKLASFIGDHNITSFLNNRKVYLHNQSIYLINKNILKCISTIPKNEILHMGLMLGKLTKTQNFYLHVSSLNSLSKYCLNKVWIKKSAEMNVLYGNNIQKAHIFKISDELLVNSSVIIYNQDDIILGFGITSKDSNGIDRMTGSSIAIIIQSDNGIYLREES